MRSFDSGDNRGFTLAEIMTVASIVALLAVVAIPNLLRARHNANESRAVATVKTLCTALESFRAAQIAQQYPVDLTELSDAVPPYVPASLTANTAQMGYTFTYLRSTPSSYSLWFDPQVNGVTGTRHFYVDQTGIIRMDRVGPADPNSPEVE